MTIKRLSRIGLVLCASAAFAVGGIWYRCQTKYHYFEWRFGKKSAITVESYSNGFYLGLGADRSPFLDGNSILWNTYDYPDGEIRLLQFRFELGYPFGSNPTSVCLPYWTLIAGCLTLLISSLFAPKVEVAQQTRTSDGDGPPN
jgi:hypothetical protein